MSQTKIAVIGAGNVGGNIGARLANAGFAVKFGVRDAKGVHELLGRAKGASSGTPAEAAAWGDVVVLAVPGSVALDVAKSLTKELDGKIVIDCNNPLTWKDGPVWNPPPEGSLAAAIAHAVPGARVLKAFNTFGAEFHADPSLPVGAVNAYVAGDDAEAKKTFAEVASKAGFAPVDVGPLRNASVLENVAMMWIHLAMVGGRGRDFAIQLVSRRQ